MAAVFILCMHAFLLPFILLSSIYMPYIFLYLRPCLAPNLTHEMCTEIVLSREDKMRGTQGIRASLFVLMEHFQLLLVHNFICVPGLHVSMALTHFLAAEKHEQTG